MFPKKNHVFHITITFIISFNIERKKKHDKFLFVRTIYLLCLSIHSANRFELFEISIKMLSSSENFEHIKIK
jgi:hypothetical protein